jgi:hypothetical protein
LRPLVERFSAMLLKSRRLLAFVGPSENEEVHEPWTQSGIYAHASE